MLQSNKWQMQGDDGDVPSACLSLAQSPLGEVSVVQGDTLV